MNLETRVERLSNPDREKDEKTLENAVFFAKGMLEGPNLSATPRAEL